MSVDRKPTPAHIRQQKSLETLRRAGGDRKKFNLTAEDLAHLEFVRQSLPQPASLTQAASEALRLAALAIKSGSSSR